MSNEDQLRPNIAENYEDNVDEIEREIDSENAPEVEAPDQTVISCPSIDPIPAQHPNVDLSSSRVILDRSLIVWLLLHFLFLNRLTVLDSESSSCTSKSHILFSSVEERKPNGSEKEDLDDTFQELFKATSERQFSFTKVYDKPSVKLDKAKKKKLKGKKGKRRKKGKKSKKKGKKKRGKRRKKKKGKSKFCYESKL